MSPIQNHQSQPSSQEDTTRSQLLESLLACDRDLENILFALNELGWDSEESLAVLNRQHIISILNRYLNKKLSSLAVENWANAVECREDISYEKNFETIIDRIIQELANPRIYRPLSHTIAREWYDYFRELDRVYIDQRLSEHHHIS
ncbi:hypothetical protein [Spirulina sp. 06S082]|uniref:hypothetical protein n=1 Tax=Spirulina sp. 06S082 TaxID=3110248 RepID=UPI002B1F7245|nr:hypothetical protein [Spirulina sp. 06S082]MEA5471706.1 hypothetical protein [Spirulina sp. 06S082]